MVKHPLTAIALAITTSLQLAQASDYNILSKADAAMLFKISKDQWNANVREAVRTGVAKAKKSADGTLTQYIFQDASILGVLPIYIEGNYRTPSAVQVSTAYRPEHPLMAALEKDPEAAPAICRRATEEMKPEFSVECEHLKAGGGMMFIFTIQYSKQK
jgi:hypothetical protein